MGILGGASEGRLSRSGCLLSTAPNLSRSNRHYILLDQCLRAPVDLSIQLIQRTLYQLSTQFGGAGAPDKVRVTSEIPRADSAV